jgi:hypothetical protein
MQKCIKFPHELHSGAKVLIVEVVVVGGIIVMLLL